MQATTILRCSAPVASTRPWPVTQWFSACCRTPHDHRLFGRWTGARVACTCTPPRPWRWQFQASPVLLEVIEW